MAESMMARKKLATIEMVCRWICSGVFTLVEWETGEVTVWKGDRELKQRINIRNRMTTGDPRVDLCHEGHRRSCNVSHLVWISYTKRPVPPEFELHHMDEDPKNNLRENLVCVHRSDHPKLHAIEEEDIPF